MFLKTIFYFKSKENKENMFDQYFIVLKKHKKTLNSENNNF